MPVAPSHRRGYDRAVERPDPAQEIERYLRTGETDVLSSAWPGNTFLEKAVNGEAALREALVAEVARRTEEAADPEALPTELTRFARERVAPMVRGLFPRGEQETVLDILGRSVVFLTPSNIARVLREARWPGTAWDLANLYLASVDAELLSEEAPSIVGLSEETTCYVPVEYFQVEDPFADFVVHEAAHVFHNVKRRTAGLEETRTREWLLDIDFRKRETFAYSCEAFSRIVALGESPTDRRRLLSELEGGPMPMTDRVDADEYVAILREAVLARNGWKRILERCSPPRAARRPRLGSV